MSANQLVNWEKRYQQGQTGWDRGAPSPALDHCIASGNITAKQHVLIPGCGHGYEVIALARLGIHVTALDLAPSAIKALENSLRQEALSATLICGDLFEYDADQTFDAIYEQTCLCALSPNMRKPYEQKLYQWLKPEGTLYFSMMQTGSENGPPFHCDWLDMQKLFDASRWQWPEKPPYMISRPEGKHFELLYQLTKSGGA